MLGIDHLISPHALGEFRQHYLGQRAVRIEGNADKFRELFGWSDINHLINYGPMQHPRARLVHETQSLPPDALSRLDHWLGQGATLIINAVQTMDPVVDRFISVLSRDMNTRVNVNCYISWPEKQGFEIHYDRHDVFVVQLAGTKAWKVFEPTLKWPVEQQSGPQGPPPQSEPYLECELTEGDVLYIPRGHWHYALSVTPSVHFTVGPQPRTPVDFLLWIAQQAMNGDEFFRQDFPLVDAGELGGRRSDKELESHLEAFSRKVADMMQDQGLKGRFLEFCMTSNPVQKKRQLPDLISLAAEITPETTFTISPEQKFLTTYDAGTRTAIVMVRGYVLRLDDSPEQILREVFDSNEPLTGKRLMAACPELAWEQVRRLLLELYDHGIAVIADED